MPLFDPEPGDGCTCGYCRQSVTACCPRETIPDSCSCPDGCQCMCLDCICEAWGEEYEEPVWPDGMYPP